MALGTRGAGFRHLALVEWHRPAAEILRHNARLHPHLWSEDLVHEEDVRQWLEKTDLKVGDVDLVAGGPPCQPFSLGGVHAGDEDERNMFPAALDAVRKLRPKFVIFENVPGLTRPSFAPYFRYIKRQLEKPTVTVDGDELWTEHDARIQKARPRSLRYVVREHLLDTADFGLPQTRRRVFLIAVRSDLPAAHTFPENIDGDHSRDALLYDQWVSGDYWAEHGLPMPEQPDGVELRVRQLKEDGRPGKGRWQTIRDAVHGLPEPIDGVDAASPANHRGIPGARVYPKHSGSSFDWPAKTIKAGVHGVSGGEAMIRFEDGSLRYLTVRESARIQGFPDEYVFPVARSRAMGAIGNAVASPLARMLAERLRATAGNEF
ncbi:phage DNA methylase [Mycobacteroides abscessus subsp. bolletii]|nr:DNA cytosine methyltransferase [Mycobacteroides abscessus subsp. bolletii]SIC30413.1 phage DNA methylase [Mycobacteroides abscessus subsp. bolletii]SIJ69194.1 phage DNA methylase [Mycobacteroides abscessus subsp. bolletii]SKT28267.1 phage DNA methylase [Mycobacteroides abscessus subsp. bolletii]SKT32983.1 phage DNA methylase [Mycobacteroides abscessus subsp. bolletii]